MASGQVSKPPAQFIEEIVEAALTAAEQKYYFALGELLEENKFGFIGMGIGSHIENANELKVLGFEEAMDSVDKDDWKASIDCKRECMLKNGVWKVVECHNAPQGADIIGLNMGNEEEGKWGVWCQIGHWGGVKQTQGNLLFIMTFHFQSCMT